jgi:hypothetical protein
MDLDRNLNSDGKGKYAIINLRKIPTNPQTPQELAAAILANPECVEFGRVGDPDEFFLIKIKDIHAEVALEAYGTSASLIDEKYGDAVLQMATRAGTNSPYCKLPD